MLSFEAHGNATRDRQSICSECDAIQRERLGREPIEAEKKAKKIEFGWRTQSQAA